MFSWSHEQWGLNSACSPGPSTWPRLGRSLGHRVCCRETTSSWSGPQPFNYVHQHLLGAQKGPGCCLGSPWDCKEFPISRWQAALGSGKRVMRQAGLSFHPSCTLHWVCVSAVTLSIWASASLRNYESESFLRGLLRELEHSAHNKWSLFRLSSYMTGNLPDSALCLQWPT